MVMVAVRIDGNTDPRDCERMPPDRDEKLHPIEKVGMVVVVGTEAVERKKDCSVMEKWN